MMKNPKFMICGALFLGALTALPVGARADAAGDALLKKCVDAMGRAQTLQAKFIVEQKAGGQSRTENGSFTLKRPNLAHIVLSDSQSGHGGMILHSDGKTFLTYMPMDKQYLREAADMGGGNVARIGSPEAMVFFHPDTLNQFAAQGRGVKIRGTITIGGTPCKVLEVVGSNPTTCRFFIGPDGILRGVHLGMGAKQTTETRLTNVTVNAPLTQTAFAWKLPREAKPFTEQVSASQQSGGSGGGEDTGLLPAGTIAPKFALNTLGGGKFTLAEATKANKAVLVNFWSYF